MTTIHAINGKKIGSSINIQLPTLQLSIGYALGWNALIATIAIDTNAPIHDVHPIVNFVDLLTSSDMTRLFYTHSK